MMKRWQIVSLVGVVALMAALVAVFILQPKPSPKSSAISVAKSVRQQPAPPARVPQIVRDNFVDIVTQKDQRVTRNHRFRPRGKSGGFGAEGLDVSAAGEMSFHSQINKGVLQQRLTAAVLRQQNGKVRQLERSSSPKTRVSNRSDKNDDKQKDKSSLYYDNIFAGLTLEYAYDGKDVEEFLHLGQDLRNEIVETNASLRVTALFPGLSLQRGDLVSTGNDGPLWPRRVNPDTAKDDDGGVSTSEAVEINSGGKLFVLAKAVAVDGNGKRLALARHFSWRPEGLQVALDLPAAWVKNAAAPIVIDPSIIDDGRAINTVTWNERTIVRGPDGTLHVGYMGVFNGNWRAMYTRGDGTNWETPQPIASMGPGENTHYTPNIVVDSTNTVHALWSDWGNCNSDPVGRGACGGWQHRIHYARCTNGCVSRNWSYGGVPGGKVLIPSTGSHQGYSHMAIDATDTVHIVYQDWSDWNIHYVQIDSSGIMDNMLPNAGQNYYAAQVVVDKNNKVHVFGANYWGSYDIHHYIWDRATSTWSALARMKIKTDAGGNGWNMTHHRANCVVDSENYIHCTLQLYDHWNTGTWHVGYGRYNPGTDAWEDVGVIQWPDRANRLHEHQPSITVDEAQTAHVVWRKNGDPQSTLLYASKAKTGGAFPASTWGAWSAVVPLVRALGSYGAPQVRPRLIYPQTVGGTPVNTVAAGILDILTVENGNTLRYMSTGQPLDGASPWKPADHVYLSNNLPTIQWRRITSDPGNGSVSYSLQVDTTPLFNSAGLLTIAAGTNAQYTLTSPLTDGAYYYWRVAAVNTHGSGPYGDIYELGIDTTPPQPFNLLTPADGSDPGTKTPTFTWQAAAD